MNWERISKYSERSGRYHVSLVYVRGVPHYELWRDRTKITWGWNPAPLKALAEVDQAEQEAADAVDPHQQERHRVR